MKKLFVESVGMVFMILCVPVYEWGDNAVFNSGFDMSPWDSGWTIEIDTSTRWPNCDTYAEVISDSGRSLPNCCCLVANGGAECSGGGSSAEFYANAMIYQTFNEIENCQIKAYVKYCMWIHPMKKIINTYTVNAKNTFYVKTRVQVNVNDEWKTIWEKSDTSRVTIDTIWTEVDVFVDTNVTGVRFLATCYLRNSCCFDPYLNVWFWIDDIYVGKAGIEESEKLRVKSLE